MFNPGLQIGQILKNQDIVDLFKCGNMGGMRRSKTTNTLVLVSDYTKGLYHDNGSVEFCIIRVWGRMETKIYIGHRMVL